MEERKYIPFTEEMKKDYEKKHPELRKMVDILLEYAKIDREFL